MLADLAEEVVATRGRGGPLGGAVGAGGPDDLHRGVGAGAAGAHRGCSHQGHYLKATVNQ